MIVMGIDPGIAITGYSFMEIDGNNKFCVFDYGFLATDSGKELHRRLKLLYDQLCEKIAQYNPQHMAVEELFFNKNSKTAILVGQARGVCLLAGAHHNLNIFEYTPLQVKQAVAGYGRASKLQVQSMVTMLLGLPAIPKPDDVADALAVSVCHINSYKMEKIIRKL
jgi:crossover junction endodeoxyribonuclease RuvC